MEIEMENKNEITPTDALHKVVSAVEDFKNKNGKEVSDLRSRIETLEALGDRPGSTSASTKGYSRDQLEHADVFLKWARRPGDGATRRALEDAQAEIEKKAVAVGAGASGGFAVPDVIHSQIELRARALNPIRQLATVVTVGSGDFRALVSKNDATTAWVGEGDTRNETTTSDLLEVVPPMGTVHTLMKASEESLQDVFFNVADWLVQEGGEAIASAETAAFISGNGSKKPLGLFGQAPVSTEDSASPERNAAALQFITPSPSSPTSLLTGLADGLITLTYSIKEKYLMDQEACGFLMRRSTAAVIRQLKDPSTGAYLWQPSFQAGQPDMLLGFRVYLTDHMDAIANDSLPVLFGNLRKAYIIADKHASLRLTVDDNISVPGQVRYYLRRRVGAKVWNNEAAKVLKVSD